MIYTGYYWGGGLGKQGKTEDKERGAYDCSSDAAAGRRRMALGTVNRAALPGSFCLFLGLNRATYNGSNDAFSSACYQQCSLLFDFDEEAYCMTNIIAFKLLHYWYILRLPQGKA